MQTVHTGALEPRLLAKRPFRGFAHAQHVTRHRMSRPALLEGLEAAGRRVQTWTAYRTTQADVEPIEVQASDVLLVTSPSAIRAWRGTGHAVPGHVLCMGEASERALREEAGFQSTRVHRLHGPSAEALRTWWRTHMEDEAWT